ncbi:MAG: tRNA (adenine57-N1/adenine58-N1)-methyltransferase catalytic subunit [Thermotogota bacterium]|nr:tRNA (adenine57-N1/adenine58-N1)-methyltransferase catalytic subunit [Thermotogota bacterium]MDK2865487.1 tRNA (adenine57-N1/adenine58-N1)-methyltransferase catalytic subunit [Thermotogota bacterium]HCZ05866.1 SAM-dependent methyltransferase [Thermotogota bacterium]
MSLISPDSWVLLVLDDGSEHLVNISSKLFVTHKGRIDLETLVDKPFGIRGKTSKGVGYYVLEPGIVDHIFNLKRRTQIVYPKDAGFILLMLDVKQGDKIVEAGLGSGALCSVLARYVGDEGRVYAYERREDFIKLAKDNLLRQGVLHRVEIKHKDISDGFEEKDVDSVVIDVNDSYNYVGNAFNSLKNGGRLAVICPTTNQVQKVLEELENKGFIKIEVWENLFRAYKTNPQRLRPVDRMVAHTAYLVFAVKAFRKESVEDGSCEG